MIWARRRELLFDACSEGHFGRDSTIFENRRVVAEVSSPALLRLRVEDDSVMASAARSGRGAYVHTAGPSRAEILHLRLQRAEVDEARRRRLGQVVETDLDDHVRLVGDLPERRARFGDCGWTRFPRWPPSRLVCSIVPDDVQLTKAVLADRDPAGAPAPGSAVVGPARHREGAERHPFDLRPLRRRRLDVGEVDRLLGVHRRRGDRLVVEIDDVVLDHERRRAGGEVGGAVVVVDRLPERVRRHPGERRRPHGRPPPPRPGAVVVVVMPVGKIPRSVPRPPVRAEPRPRVGPEAVVDDAGVTDERVVALVLAQVDVGDLIAGPDEVVRVVVAADGGRVVALEVLPNLRTRPVQSHPGRDASRGRGAVPEKPRDVAAGRMAGVERVLRQSVRRAGEQVGIPVLAIGEVPLRGRRIRRCPCWAGRCRDD